MSVKKSPEDFLTFSPNSWEFLVQILYNIIMRSYLRWTTNFYPIISNYDEVMPY